MKTFRLSQSRRHFLKLSGSAGLALLLRPKLGLSANAPGSRRIVFLEMNGGNDGLNTVIPYNQGTYYDLRPKLAIPAASVLALNNQTGFHPALARLHQRFQQGQVAILQGVGHPNPDLSHFAMQEYWQAGNPLGMTATGQTGWLGRVLDALMPGPDVLTGLSLSDGIGPVLASKTAIVAALTDASDQPYIPWQYQSNDLFWSLFNGLTDVDSNDSGPQAASKTGMRHSRLALDLLATLQPNNSVYPNTETARLLELGAQILGAATDVQVLHIPLPLDFDTHSNQANRQNANLTELDGALDAFLNDLSNRQLASQTIVVIVSEFGRRAAENDNLGTDHGTANNVFIIGSPVSGGFYGQQPSLTDLDNNGNLKMNLSYLDVLGSISENWLGVSANLVVPGGQVLQLFRS